MRFLKLENQRISVQSIGSISYEGMYGRLNITSFDKQHVLLRLDIEDTDHLDIMYAAFLEELYEWLEDDYTEAKTFLVTPQYYIEAYNHAVAVADFLNTTDTSDIPEKEAESIIDTGIQNIVPEKYCSPFRGTSYREWIIDLADELRSGEGSNGLPC